MGSREANSTIKGFMYQMLKSFYEILNLTDDATLQLEGVIEDIDITTAMSTSAIQCKYYESQDYSISKVAPAILEMYSNYCYSQPLGKDIKYKLYAYFGSQNQNIQIDEIKQFILDTKNKDIIIKYLSKIFIIDDIDIVKLIEKSKKTEDDKTEIKKYIEKNKSVLKFKYDLKDFWNVFEYEEAVEYDKLKANIINELELLYGPEIAENLYFGNGISLIANYSTFSDAEKRIIDKKTFFELLNKQKSILFTRWAKYLYDYKVMVKNKKSSMRSKMNFNSSVRLIYFSKQFLNNNSNQILPFLISYIDKFNTKKSLNKPPIVIFEESDNLLNEIVYNLFGRGIYCNVGIVCNIFDSEMFITNKGVSADFKIKLTTNSNANNEIVNKMNIDQAYYVGNFSSPVYDINNCEIEILDLENIIDLRTVFSL